MTLTPINFPDPTLEQEHEIDLGNGDTIIYVWNGLTWVRKDSKVLDDLADVNVDLDGIVPGKFQYLVYDPDGDGTWVNSEIRTDGFLVYKGILDINQVGPTEDPISGHLYVHEFSTETPPVNPTPTSDWVGIETIELQGSEKVIFNGTEWEIFADFEGSLLPDSLFAVDIPNDGVEANKLGHLNYEADVEGRRGLFTYMPITDVGLQSFNTIKDLVARPEVTDDEIESWNENLNIDLDGVVSNGNSTYQRLRLGKDIRFRPFNDEGKVIGKTLESVLGDGTFRWATKQLAEASKEFITAEFLNNNYFLATESVAGVGPTITTSNDRQNWTESDTSTLPEVNINSFSYSSMAKVYLAATDGGHIFYSTDKVNWTESDSNAYFDGSDVYGIDYAFDQFIAVGKDGKVATSQNGVNWTELTSLTDITVGADMYDVKHGENGVWQVVGDLIGFISDDYGENWNSNIISDTIIRCVDYGNGVFAAGSDDSIVRISKDSAPNISQWIEYPSVISGTIQDILYVPLNEYWMVVGDEVNYKLDKDDVWFTPTTTGVGGRTYSAATDGNLLVMAHSNGYLVNGYLFNGGLFYDGDLLVTEALLQDITANTSLQSLVDTDVNSVEDGQVLVYRGGLWTGVAPAEVPEVIRFVGFVDAATVTPTITDPGTLYIQHSDDGGPVTIGPGWAGVTGTVVSEGEYLVFSGTDNEWHRSGGSAASQIKSDWDETDTDAASFIYNKPDNLVSYPELSLNTVVTNPHPSAFPPDVTDQNLQLGEKLMLGKEENFLLAEDDQLVYQDAKVITSKDIAVPPNGLLPGEAGIVIPGDGIDYDPVSGQMNVIISDQLNYRGIIETSTQTPVGDEVPGDFYLVGSGVISLGSDWNFDPAEDVSTNDKVILNLDGTAWVIIPDPLATQSLLDITSDTFALRIDKTDTQRPVLSILDATSLTSGLLTSTNKIRLDTIQTAGNIVSDINSTNPTLVIEKVDAGGHPLLYPTHDVKIDILTPTLSPNGYGVVNTLESSEIVDRIIKRATGLGNTPSQDTYLEAEEVIDNFLPYVFDIFPEVPEVVETP